MTDLFRSLHVPGRPLVLVDVWDVLSARLAEAAGAAAPATTSGGVSWSLGAADGGVLQRAAAVDVVRRIAGAVDVPLSADVEDGFADSPEGVAETVGVLVSAGVAGINIEDAWHGGPEPLRSVRDESARVARARAAAADTLCSQPERTAR